MKNNYEGLDTSLNIESNIVEVEKVKDELNVTPMKSGDIQKDYEYTRANLYSLIEKVKKQSMELWNLPVKEVLPEHMKLLDN